MKDKDWLDKISVAYKSFPYPNINIEFFILWLYRQYGIVPPEERKKKDKE